MDIKIILFVFLHCVAIDVHAQTCCSAGVPMSALLEIVNTNEKSFSIQANYEYRSINLLVDNNSRLENDPRSRYGQNVSFKLDYILNSKWAFSTLIPFVHHSRNTSSESQNSFGLGDISILTQYSIFSNLTHNLNLLAGVELPTGIVNHKGSSQIILSPDMQSGSGSFDFLLGVTYSKSDFLTPFLSGFINTSYRWNGSNENFGSRDNFAGRSFAFGDEFVAIAGLKFMHTMKSGFLIPDLSLKMRRSGSNIEQNVDAPNSGGRWISLPLGLSYVPDNSKSMRIYTEFPIYQDLNGLQITTDFIIGIQFRYTRDRNKIGEI